MENVIASCFLIAIVALIIGLSVYKMRKQNKNMTIEEFIDTYHENIIRVLQDVVCIMQINIEEFEDKESYNKAIISTTIEKLKENAGELGIDRTLINLFSTEALTNALYGLFYEEEYKIFSKIGYEAVASNAQLYTEATVMKLKHDNNTIM